MGASCCKEETIDFSSEIELSHFHLLRSVGKGAFGKVRVVQHKKTKEIYALKYINKAKCIRMRAVENIIQERRLLEEVEFSLICNLRYAFQDDENLFMVLDLMLGGDLRFHLERAGPMREDVVRFYVAELALALDALHARRIIHRDLKPDNVLLDEHGHAHLTDFNIAVYFNPSKPLVSIAGSMAYMAPEVLMRKGYLESVDWWSLGVVMFELLFGKRPFRGKSNELLTNSILRDSLPLPDNADDIISAPCLDVLSKLCERDISKRLGCTPEGMDAFKKHPWFHGIEWDKLVTKEAIPPFEPDSKRANFDATHELEELLMEDNPLKAKKRAQTTPETELSHEMQMMEDNFIVYDYTKVKRSHSLSRPVSAGKSLFRSVSVGHGPGHGHGHGHKMSISSTTLEGVLLTRNSSGRIENLPMMNAQAPVKAYRPDSPSDLVGRERFNSDEDEISLLSVSDMMTASGVETIQTQQQQQHRSPSLFPSADAEKTALQQKQQNQVSHQTNENSSLKPEASAYQQSSKDNFSYKPIHTSTPSVAVAPVATPTHTHPPAPSSASSNKTPYDDSTAPSSPSNSSGYSTLSTPPTTYNSSPATHKPCMTPCTELFSTPESAATLSTITQTAPFTSPLAGSESDGIVNTNDSGGDGTHLMGPAAIPLATALRSRNLRGFEKPSLSLSAKGGRAFELSTQAMQEKQLQQQLQGGHQRRHSRHRSGVPRPMSAYTISNAGSIHESMVGDFSDSKSVRGHGPGFYHHHSYRASISGIEDINGGLGLGLNSSGVVFETEEEGGNEDQSDRGSDDGGARPYHQQHESPIMA
ncbi:hypothetical protein BGZ51_003264 [Haplosporangium sp. Z 767]|nr:hypothetical protein BGZ51_003264 [Haplosporangium sp. Z 767]KAF9195796.1 hypothetical protein BGZ50_003507 [Haplosporangium sp. Z 11]